MDNVVQMFGRKKPEQPARVPVPVSVPVEALIEWAESNGIDVQNDIRFHVRMTDFLSLLRNAVNETEMRKIA